MTNSATFNRSVIPIFDNSARLLQLQQQTQRQEAIVKHFENNNEEYIKIAKTVKDTVHYCLPNVRTLLDIALMSLIESLGEDPSKYNSLVQSLQPEVMMMTIAKLCY